MKKERREKKVKGERGIEGGREKMRRNEGRERMNSNGAKGRRGKGKRKWGMRADEENRGGRMESNEKRKQKGGEGLGKGGGNERGKSGRRR